MESLPLEKNDFPLVPQSEKLSIEKKFKDYKALALEWSKAAYEIKVTSVNDKEQIKKAKEGFKLLKDKRVELEKKRKELKDKSLQEGRFIDSVAKALTEIIEPAEKHLEKQAKYAETLKKQELELLKAKRKELLAPYAEVINPDEYPLESLSDIAFETILTGAQKTFEAYQAQKEEEAKQKAKEEEAKKVFIKRSLEISPYKFFTTPEDAPLTLNTTEEEYLALLKELMGRKEKQDKEREEKEKEAAEALAKAKAESEKAEQLQKEADALKKEKEQFQAEAEVLKKEKESVEKQNQDLQAKVEEINVIGAQQVLSSNDAGQASNAPIGKFNVPYSGVGKSASNAGNVGAINYSTEDKLLLATNTLESLLAFILPDNARGMIYDTLKKIK